MVINMKQSHWLNQALNESKEHLAKEYGADPDTVWLDARGIENDGTFIICIGGEGAILYVLKDDGCMAIKEYSDAIKEYLGSGEPVPVHKEEDCR